MRRLSIAVWLGVLVLVACGALIWLSTPTSADEVRREYVRLTFYTLRGQMRWGAYTYKGAAACGSYFPPGTQLEFRDGFTVTCEDTGRLAPAQVDVWAPSWQWGHDNIADPATGGYGDYAWVTVVRWGWNDE